MIRSEFMRRLESGIARMPEQEKIEALRYYEEYFDEAGPENEEQVLSQLEDPEVIATRLMAEYAYIQTQSDPANQNKSSNVKLITMIVLGICAAPIAFPLIIAIVSVIFALLITVFSIAFVFAITGFVLFLVGIITFIVSFVALFTNFMSGILGLGASLILIGIGLLISILFYLLVFGLLPLITKGIGNIFRATTRRKKI